jgi:hypothetical protein
MIQVPNLKTLLIECKKNDLLPPLDMSRYFPNMVNIALVCVTESNSRESLEKFVSIAKNVSEVKNG